MATYASKVVLLVGASSELMEQVRGSLILESRELEINYMRLLRPLGKRPSDWMQSLKVSQFV